MLRGIDISHWDAEVPLMDLDIDFCIVKATQGTNWCDTEYVNHARQCLDAGMLWGVYHFANGDDPESEADWFHNQVRPYIDIDNPPIPVLDFEIELETPVSWCERFITRYHELTGLWPLLYISASLCHMFTGSFIVDVCELWVAGYPTNLGTWDHRKCPYDVTPWPRCAIWQFTSRLYIWGYDHALDGNLCYIDNNEWLQLAGGTDMPLSDDDIKRIADAVWAKVLANSRGNKSAGNLLSWAESYSQDMQPWMAETLKRVKIIQEKVTDDARD